MRYLIICLLLSGCIVDNYNYVIKYSDIVYVGDSLCWEVYDTPKSFQGVYENQDYEKTAQARVGIVSNCVPGRKATDIDQLPDGYRIVWLALGTNDVRRTPIDEFRLHYQTLVYNSDAEYLFCVLPNKTVFGHDAEPYRQVIRDTCANVVDPLDYGVRFRAKDTVHMNMLDHKLWVKAIIERLFLIVSDNLKSILINW